MGHSSKHGHRFICVTVGALMAIGSGCSTIQGSYVDKCQKNKDGVSLTNYMEIGDQVHMASIAYFNDPDCTQGEDAIRYWGGEKPVIHEVNDQIYIVEFTQKQFIEQNNNEKGRPAILERLRKKGYVISPELESNYLREGVLVFQTSPSQVFVKIERTGRGGVVTPWISDDFASAVEAESDSLFERSTDSSDYFDWILQRSAQATAGLPPLKKPATAEKMGTTPTEVIR